MQVSRKAMKQEVSHVRNAMQRRDQVLKQRQAALKTGFDADLAQQDKLSKTWVKEATIGYVAAREALLRQHHQTNRAHHQRIDNLQSAMHAQQRAIDLLQRQDRVLQQQLGGDLWQWQTLLNRDKPAKE
jgi:hypothetical protein